MHIVYEKSQKSSDKKKSCGTSKDWEEAWKSRYRREEEILLKTKANSSKVKTRGLDSIHRYLETLVVADKKFMEHHRNTDYEMYILTIMNMASK